MRRAILVLLLLPVLGSTAGARDPEGHRSWDDVEHWAKVFDDPARDEWQKPLSLLNFLGIEPGETVADIGAGTGYFTKTLSIQVGEKGKVYAVDISQPMLDHLMSRKDVVAERVVPVLGAADDPKLPAGAIDAVVVLNTWHHIGKRSKYLSRLAQALSPEGRVTIIDWRDGELPMGPPPEDKLPRERVISEFEKAGFRFVAESVMLPYQYALVFRLPAKKDTRRYLTR